MKDRFTNIMIKLMILFTTLTGANLYAVKTWNGSASTDWNNVLNWSGTLPSSTDDVIIPGSLINYPEIVAFQNITIKNLTINPGGYLSISGGSLTTNNNKIIINGSVFTQTAGTVTTRDMELKNGGTYNQSGGEFQISRDLKVPLGTTFNGTDGTVRFTGAAGNGAIYTGNVQFYNLIVNAGADYNLANGDVIKIAGNYTNNNISLDNDKGTLIFNGSAPQTIYSASSPASTRTIAANVIISNPSVILLSDVGIHTSLTSNSGGHINKNGSDIYLAGVLYTGPTPVELVAFNAKVRNNVVLLDWRTATEVNNYGFEIERSLDNEMWLKIGFVNGHGNSNSPKEYFFEDSKLSNNTYQYRLRQVDNDGSFAYSNIVKVNIDQLPNNFALNQNYPNPFNPGTKISWQSPVGSWQTLKVYDILGNEVATLVNEFREAEFYEVDFNASHLTSGIYIYKINVGNFSETKKMMLTK
jgi:hypothetical protein